MHVRSKHTRKAVEKIKFKECKSLTLLIGVFACFWLFLYSRPWVPSFLVSVDKGQGFVVVKAKDKEGIEFTRQIDLDPENGKTVRFSGAHLVSYSSTPEARPRFFVDRNPGNPVRPEDLMHGSLRNDPIVLSGITLASSFGCMFLFWIFFVIHEMVQLRKDISIYPVLILHASFLSLLGFATVPGFFNYDTFVNFSDAARYVPNLFPGNVYSLLMMCLYQVWDYAWVLMAMNLILIFTVLVFLYTRAANTRSKIYYFCACLIFYLYPANIIMSVSLTRDTFSHWIMFLTMILLYFHFMEVYSQKIFIAWLTGAFAVLTCSLRQETIFFFPLLLILIGFFKSRDHRRWCILTAIACVAFPKMFDQLLSNIKRASPLEVAHYQTTAIVSPLSYILHEKYPDGLPSEVNQKLGQYFKNDYLVSHFGIRDIFPFHKGGVNFNASYDDYKKFRNESIKIILSNFPLYLENRLKVSILMFGFSNEENYLLADEYYKDSSFFSSTKEDLRLKHYQRSGFYKLLEPYILSVYRFPTYVVSGYFIPIILLILVWILLPKAVWFRTISVIILSRTVVLVALSPGGYFKYNYILWLFGLFSLFLAISEHRANCATRKSPTTST